MLRVPAPVAARWLGLAAATAYALLAGWGVPAQRTVWMLAVAVVLRSAGWRWPWPLRATVAVILGRCLAPKPCLAVPTYNKSWCMHGLHHGLLSAFCFTSPQSMKPLV